MVHGIAQDLAVSEPVRRGRRWWRVLGAMAGWLLLVAGAIGVGLHYNTWVWEPAVLAASFASYLMVGGLVAIVVLGLARQWVSAGLAVVVSAGALWSQLPMLWPDGSAPPGTDLVVMQSNLELGRGNAEAVVRAARENSAEVLTIEELTPELLNRLDAAGLAELLPHRYTAPSGGGQGTGIFSRYPLQDGVKFEGFWLNNLRATMIHPTLGSITVFAFHPIPPLSNAGVWSHELTRIHELLTEQTGKVVVGGDFNSTYDHAAFRALTTGRYADSAELLGVGALPTWPTDRSWGPIIGIDRVLLAEGSATAIHSHDIPDTDHRAVVARLRF
ncbi:endonuclease/exonuclease/phosphatase family protein [Nocardia sp. NPDC059240]|uniref:endonuclease/exonuclease/phosphatase family protein n=1 Tax=Nocardia sp. NPDC059240 TaxID=3346786 RepID=UPI00369F3C06